MPTSDIGHLKDPTGIVSPVIKIENNKLCVKKKASQSIAVLISIKANQEIRSPISTSNTTIIVYTQGSVLK